MTFTSLGNAKASIAVAVVRKFILLIPLIYAMPRIFHSSSLMSTYAIDMAEPIADTLGRNIYRNSRSSSNSEKIVKRMETSFNKTS